MWIRHVLVLHTFISMQKVYLHLLITLTMSGLTKEYELVHNILEQPKLVALLRVLRYIRRYQWILGMLHVKHTKGQRH